MASELEKWSMPEWMEPYREHIADYGLGIEDLMNDRQSTFFNNEYRAAVIVGLKDQIGLLTRLHNANRLRLDPSTPVPSAVVAVVESEVSRLNFISGVKTDHPMVQKNSETLAVLESWLTHQRSGR